MKPDIYYGTVLKTCRDFDIILVNNFIDRVTVTGNFLFGCCSHTLLHCPVNSDAVVFSAKKRQWGSREDLACAQWIWGRIVGLYEQAASDDGEIMRPKEPNWTAWANDVRTMRMLDGRSHRQICEMFGRVQRDPFWVKNIMSPSKLREKWDELVIRLGRSPVQRCVNHISEPDTEIPPGFRG